MVAGYSVHFHLKEKAGECYKSLNRVDTKLRTNDYIIVTIF